MQAERAAQALAAFEAFLNMPLETVLSRHSETGPEQAVLGLFHSVVSSVPTYRAFLAEQGVEPATIRTFDDFKSLPQVTKKNYQLRYPLADLRPSGQRHQPLLGPRLHKGI